MSVAKIRTPRGAWVHAALQALAAGGPDAVRVEALAVSLGVSKGGFYWHFADRQALLEEMLDTWEKTGTEDIMARVQSQPGDVRAKLQKLFEVTSWPEGLRSARGLPSNWPSGTGPAATATSRGGCAGPTTGAWSSCARCSGSSARTRTMSRCAACWPTRR